MLAGLAAANAAGLRPVKVNTIVDPETGLEDVVPLVRFCLQHDYQLRIIEQMPLDAGHEWRREAEVVADRVLATLRHRFTLRPDPSKATGKSSDGVQLQRVFNNRHIETLFRDFASVKFFLARDNIREVLVVR